jgi:hypothetical protein
LDTATVDSVFGKVGTAGLVGLAAPVGAAPN